MSKTNIKSKPRIGIKWKMFAIIAVFVVGLLLSIWFVQVRLLNVFYQNAKFYELKTSAELISSSFDNEFELRSNARQAADEYSLDIWILKIYADNNAEWVIKTDGTINSSQQYLSLETLKTLYVLAEDNGGVYIATVPLDSIDDGFTLSDVLKDNRGKGNSFPDIAEYNYTIGTVYVRIDEVDGQRYMTIQHANMTPLQTTVSTLRYQFLSIGIGMGIMSLLLVFILSKLITKPFVNMNNAAKKLAKGNYDADFTSKSYREIDELADTLNFAARELAKTDNLQKELISNISHDLRTPLTMIKGYGEVMRDIPNENTPENIQVIIDETERLSALVNDMLDLSKIQAGTRKPYREEFSITETVRDTLTRYEKLIMQDGYRIDFINDRDVSVYADRVMILQVIYNLINNAINYTGEDKYVRVEQYTTDTYVRISVSDTGEGIKQEDMGAIWERYYRVDKVHKRAAIGTGLGLSIVKGILESHGARYGVISTEGRGATFWFELELAKNLDIIDAEYEKTQDGEI